MARTILVVDDEPTLRETLAEALESEGHRVVTAADGREALVRFRAERPDLVLLDLMLPELSGIEVCRIIRAESGVPIIMLTAKDAELDKVVGLELGADDYVTKPFSLRELTARIRAIFRRSEQQAVEAPPALIDLGRVQIDLAGHRLLRDGRPVPVKPKAFELLAFLVRHPGRVFTRDQLLEHVWGYDYAGETRTVDVHIHWLRARSRTTWARRPCSTRFAASATGSAARPDPASAPRGQLDLATIRSMISPVSSAASIVSSSSR
jgi:two-component system response regulator RegX3